MDPGSLLQLIVLILLLLLSAFFSLTETAFSTVNKLPLQELAEDGNKSAGTVLNITANPGKMLRAFLIINTIIRLAAAAVTTALAYRFGGLGMALGCGLLVILLLIFAEIIPQTLAAQGANRIALATGSIVFVFLKAMTPVVFLINTLARVILRLFGVSAEQSLNAMTENELRTLLHVSQEDGLIEDEEKQMIYNVFDLGDAKAKDVMVPRVHVTFASIDNTYEELIAIFREDKYTRLPVYAETTDNVIGTINMKDLLLYDNRQDFQLQDILREAYFTYEYKNISELLIEMRHSSFNIAIVLDEYGETSGLITLEDILEEIVGEIRDEYDEHEEDIIRALAPREYLVEGSINLDDLNEALGINLQSDDYDSLGGYIIEQLDRFPEIGDYYAAESGLKLVVESLDKNRIENVHIYLPAVTAAEPEV